jgi:hypothetical protein
MLASIQGFDVDGWFMPLRAVPVFEQCGPVKQRPLNDKRVRSARQLALERGQSLDRDRCFLCTVHRMKVRHIVLARVHAHDDAEEAADGQHGSGSLRRMPRA